MENDKINSLRNLFYLQKFQLNEKLNLLPHLVRKFQINARNKLQSAFQLLPLRPHLLNMVFKVYVKNKLGSQKL